MRLYMAVVVSGFRRYATYRAATVAGVFTNCVFGFIVAYTYMALWEQRPQLGGYDLAQALTYVWVAQGVLAASALIGGGFHEELQERIRSGDVAVDLYRPVDLQLWWLAADAGRAAFQLLGRGVLPVLVGALAFDLALPTSPLTWLCFLLALVLGVLVSFTVRYLLALSAFWLLDGTGVNMIGLVLSLFFSGMILPLNVFPGALGAGAEALPWAAILQVPVDVLLGRHQGTGLFAAFAFQLGWALALLAVGRAVQSVATRKVVVQGG
ncbi:ABC-2 family transporter protein [Streptomyces sp. HSW2009]|uniref:ABC transporter permease n=1 Tax=Streptomyces sp. HSW2009 TaxID=3142890 RepID=UPI0032EBBECB